MATVQQYLAWAERRIAKIVTQEGLRLGLVKVVQGPLTITFCVRLLQPSPSSLRRVLSLGPALAQALQVESVRVDDSVHGVLIELPSPVQRTPSALMLTSHTHQLSVAVGLDQFRRPVQVDLRQHGALLWVGPSRRGKTESLKSTVYALARTNRWQHLHYVVLSQKRQDWQAFEAAAGCLGVVSAVDESIRVLEWAAGRVLPGRAQGARHLPVLLVVVDDLLNLLERAPQVAGPLAEIASMGAGLGVHLLAGTQEAGSKRGTGGPAVESNCTCRIVYRSSSASAAARAAGMKAAGVAQLSSARGDALLIVDGETKRIATGWADDRLILQLPAGDMTEHPWRSTTSATAAPTAAPTAQLPSTSLNRWQPLVASPTFITAETQCQGDRSQPVDVVALVDQLIARFFPLPRRAPTAVEAEAIRTVWTHLERWATAQGRQASLSELTRIVYGGKKDGDRFAWVKAALVDTQTITESSFASTLDPKNPSTMPPIPDDEEIYSWPQLFPRTKQEVDA